MPGDHERGREEVRYAGRADRCHVGRCFAQDLWILSVGVDNNPWGQYQPLIPMEVLTSIEIPAIVVTMATRQSHYSYVSVYVRGVSKKFGECYQKTKQKIQKN